MIFSPQKKTVLSEEHKPRFRSAEEALRFYFRVRELLQSGRARRLVADELPAHACIVAADAVDDYQCIGWCMRGLDVVALWLLGDIYGPTCFGVRRRTFSHARSAGRIEFPQRQFRLCEVRLLHEHALGVVKRGLRELAMIPARPVQPLDERRRRMRSAPKRPQLRGHQLVNRG
jgi:hypothetical protein